MVHEQLHVNCIRFDLRGKQDEHSYSIVLGKRLKREGTSRKTSILTSAEVLSTNRCATELVSASICVSMNSMYPSSEELSSSDGCGGGTELSRSTNAAQRLSHAFFPLTAEASASDGLERLNSSFPTLSACLSKNLCKTIESVSSRGRPIHSSGSDGSPLASYFWRVVGKCRTGMKR